MSIPFLKIFKLFLLALRPRMFDYRNIILKSILREALFNSKHLSLLGNVYYINEIYQSTKIVLFNPSPM